MPQVPRAVAIYARISSDAEGTGAGVARQVEDCRKMAASLGWPVAGEYVDNDVSAYSGKRRPQYERMLADLSDGLVDGVIVYHIDRLTRRPVEVEHFLSVVDEAKVRHVRFVTGDTDLNTGDGLLIARIFGAVAANESAAKSRRVRRKMEQVAAEGRPHGGSGRPFGYEADRVTVRAEEAETYRSLVARYLAGESTKSLATWLNESGVQSVRGAGWRTTTVRAILANPRYAGIRAHRKQVVGPAVWEPIISEETHRKVLAKMAEKASSTRRTPQRYLLSGMLRCGKCQNRLFSAPRKNTRRYVCLSGPDHGGCGRLTVVADPLERLIADAVLYRLDTPEMADVLAGRSSTDERTQALSTTVDAAQEQLEELAAAYAHQAITMREWMTARKSIEERLKTAQRQLAQVTRTDALVGLVGNGDAVGVSWSTLSLSRQVGVVAAVIDHVVIGPGTPGATGLDRSRVSVVWRH